MGNGVDREALCVCSVMERDAPLIQDGGDQRLMDGISTVITDKTLLPRIIYNVYVASTVSKERHSDISPETLLKK